MISTSSLQAFSSVPAAGAATRAGSVHHPSAAGQTAQLASNRAATGGGARQSASPALPTTPPTVVPRRGSILDLQA